MAKTIALDVTTSQAGFTTLMGKIQSALVDRTLVSAALGIGTSSKKKVKLVAAPYFLANGVLGTVAINTEVTIGATTITNAKFNVIVLSVNSAGTVTATFGTEAATLAAVVFPTVPANEAVLGFVIVNPTGTGNFVGGTTDFDDGTVTPNAVYINTLGFNTNVLSL